MRYSPPRVPEPDVDARLAAAASPERVPLLRAALRVLGETAAYRIRKHEANNLAGTVSLLVARGATLPDLALRTAFAALLNLLVYLLNDLGDVELDLGTPGKDRRKTEFLRQHRRAALVALVSIFVVLLAVALLHAPVLVAALVASSALVGVYTFWLKRLPLVDVALMGVCGFTMTLCGVREGDLWRSLTLAGFLGLVSASFQVLQVVRDVAADRAAGLRTTAAVLGLRGAGLLFRGLTLVLAAYAFFVVHSYAAVGVLLALALPVDPTRATRTWDLARLLFGAAWIAMLLGV